MEAIQNNFYPWFIKTYHTEPECLYINLLLFPLELFQEEKEEELLKKMPEYLEYYSKTELRERFQVIRTYLKTF